MQSIFQLISFLHRFTQFKAVCDARRVQRIVERKEFCEVIDTLTRLFPAGGRRMRTEKLPGE